MEVENAKITSTHLGYEDHGIFTYFITVGGDSWGQSFGGYTLGGEYTDKVIKGLLKALEVEKWEELQGQFVRIKKEEPRGKIVAIGHLIKDSWFVPADI